MLYNYLFVLLGYLADSVLNILFPVKFAFDGMYFVPCIGLCAIVLMIRKLKGLDGILLLLFYGMAYDFFYANTPFFYTIVYVLIYIVIQIWSKLVNESIIESVVLCISTIFTKEIMVYLFMKISGQTTIGFNTFVSNRLFLTILVNALLVCLLVLLAYIKDDLQRRKDLRIRREERLPWLF